MEEQDLFGNIDNPDRTTPSDPSPASDAPHTKAGVIRLSLETGKKALPLSRRLAEAFREGVATAKSGNGAIKKEKMPPPDSRIQAQSGGRGFLDRAKEEGGSAAAVVYDKTAGALGSVVELVKKTPVESRRLLDAFREGAASVKRKDVGSTGAETRRPAKTDRGKSLGAAVLDRVFKAGDTAKESVRGAVASVKPGATRNAESKIRKCEKEIKKRYVHIGREAVEAWSSGGPVETGKIEALIAEVVKNEEEIHSLRLYMAENAAARQAEAIVRTKAVESADAAPATVPGRGGLEFVDPPAAPTASVAEAPAMAPAQETALPAEPAPPEGFSTEAAQAEQVEAVEAVEAVSPDMTDPAPGKDVDEG